MGDGHLYLRVDFAEEAKSLNGLEVQVHFEGTKDRDGAVRIEDGSAVVRRGAVTAAYKNVLEMAVPVSGAEDRVGLSFWQDGLPIEAIPREGAFDGGAGSGWNG
jgi:hypothetical protein